MCVRMCVCVAGGRPTPPAAARPEMPGVLPSDGSAPPRGSPSRKNRLSLKLFQKKEAKRALDFTEPPENEQKGAELRGAEMYVGVRVLPVGIPLCACCRFPLSRPRLRCRERSVGTKLWYWKKVLFFRSCRVS